MLNIFHFLNALKRKEVSNELTYDDLGICISESGWHLINHSNSVPKNANPSPSMATKFDYLKNAATSDPQCNWWVHPSSMEGTEGDHVLVTIPKKFEGITEDNFAKSILGIVKSRFVGNWADRRVAQLGAKWLREHGYIALRRKKRLEKFEIELVDRRKLLNQPRSTHLRLQYDDIYEEFFWMHTSRNCVVVSFSASPRNVDHYRRIMFEIADSIELSS